MANYFLFEDDKLELNLIFDPAELEVFVELWNNGCCIKTIADEMKRKVSEIALLIFDHAERDLIKPRPGIKLE